MHVRATDVKESDIIEPIKGHFNKLTKTTFDKLNEFNDFSLSFEDVKNRQKTVSKESFNPVNGLYDSNVNLKDCNLRPGTYKIIVVKSDNSRCGPCGESEPFNVYDQKH